MSVQIKLTLSVNYALPEFRTKFLDNVDIILTNIHHVPFGTTTLI